MRRAALLAVALLAACGPSFPPVSLVTELRVLAVRADAPEMRPGDTALLTALVVDPRGAGREVTITWGVCTPPGLVTDLLTCQDPENVRPLGVGPSVTVRAPSDYLESGPRGRTDRRFMYVVFLAQAGDERVAGFKELLVTSRMEPLNQNPRLQAARATAHEGGATLTEAEAGELVTVVAEVEEASREEYQEDGEAKKEELAFSWFATAGTWKSNRTFEEATNDWTAPLEPQTVQLWVVVRDDRNGVDWRTFTLVVHGGVGAASQRKAR
jgi:hypothetical protein